MKRITVELSNPYDILIEHGLLNNAGEYIRQLSDAKKAVIVTDSNVGPLYVGQVTDSLEKAGFSSEVFTFPAGESSKVLATLSQILSFFAENELSRSDMIVALGGGVTSDIAGFAAAVYLRGTRFVSIPTSLLAQIDASVGGKTGCDIPQGKNLIGAFHQPSAVLIDPAALDTLPRPVLCDGMAEAIKYGCIMSPRLFDSLAEKGTLQAEELISECILLKKRLVEQDEKDLGDRMLLNFGHTLGHAIEKYYGFSGCTHGQAVSIGMAVMALAGEKAGLTAPGSAEKIIAAAKAYGLPTSCGAKPTEIACIAGKDKKVLGGKLNLVLIRQIGDAFLYPIASDELFGFISEPNWWRS
ncbi:MAG TPA: 3-dehydroquinate synthase [Ruminococcaceae bacterium]|nr:3-dehydroquinate synthase [Oscillospiraceae bacterium]